MKKHKLESQFKEKLALRRIDPSPEVWEQLDRTLQLKNKRKLLYGYALVGVVLVLLGWNLFYENSSFTTLPNTEQPLVEEENFIKIIPSEPSRINNPTRETKQPLSVGYIPQSKALQSFDINTIIPSLAQLNPLPIPLVKQDEQISDSLLQLETEALLQLAYKNIRVARNKQSKQQLKALELLIAVETELYSEIQLKTKIIDFIRGSYTKVSMNSNEINQ